MLLLSLLSLSVDVHRAEHSLSRGDETLIKPFDHTNSHNNGPWQTDFYLESGDKATFYSQFDEDRMLVMRYPEWLSMRGGTYLEMGALDGYHFSNTNFFSRSLGWHGMLVEPQPACEARLRKRRPHDAIITNASCSDFRVVEIETRHDSVCAPGNGAASADDALTRRTRLTVGCSPIGHMLHASGIKQLDLWSLDSSAPSTLETLRGMDWEHIPVRVLLIEMLPGSNPKGEEGLEEIRQYLFSKGFQNQGRVVGTSGYDEVWENPIYPLTRSDIRRQ